MAVFDILQKILQSNPFLMLQNFETQGCQWHGIKRIKSILADKENSATKFRPASLLHQVVLISSMKPNSSRS